jgi:hypothetical protein
MSSFPSEGIDLDLDIALAFLGEVDLDTAGMGAGSLNFQ